MGLLCLLSIGRFYLTTFPFNIFYSQDWIIFINLHIILTAKTEEKILKMVSDINYWSKVLKRLFLLALTVGIILICFKLSVFYMPFLVSFVLALLLEPLIRFLMKKCKWTRRFSSIFVMVIAVLIIVRNFSMGSGNTFLWSK